MKLVRIFVIAGLGLVSSGCCLFAELEEAIGRAILQGFRLEAERFMAWSVQPLADLDGDGVGDLLITAELPSDPSRVRAYVLSGRTFEPIYAVDFARSQESLPFDWSRRVIEGCGAWAPIPDDDGDGIADIAVGCVRIERTSNDQKMTTTRVSVLSGKDGHTARDLWGDEAQQFAMEHASDNDLGLFARKVESVGSLFSMTESAIWMTVTVPATASDRLKHLLGPTAEPPPPCVSPLDSAHEKIQPVGDIDGDGITDWMRPDGAQRVVTLISGRDGHGLASYGASSEGATWDVLLGVDIGDLDGDGIPDVALLFSHHLLGTGSAQGQCVSAWLTIHSGADGRVLRTIEREKFLNDIAGHCPVIRLPE